MTGEEDEKGIKQAAEECKWTLLSETACVVFARFSDASGFSTSYNKDGTRSCIHTKQQSNPGRIFDGSIHPKLLISVKIITIKCEMENLGM